MREQRLPDFDVIDLPEHEPIILVGQPHAMQGELRVHNRSGEKVVLRDVQVRSEPLKAAVANVTTSVAHTLAVIVLRPGQMRRIPLTVAISPHTPSGEYQGELEVAGRVRSVVLQVTEVIQLDISPPQLVIENRVGETIVKRVVFTNSGNVSLTIGEIGPVVLDEEFMECRTGRAAVFSVGDQVKSVNDYLAEVVRQTKVVLEQTGVLRVHNTAGIVILQPGEVRSIDLAIRVPEKLDKRSRYFGAVPLYTSNLQFTVVPAPSKRVR